MHELSLAAQIRRTVLKAAAAHAVDQVIEVDIEIGELSLFNPDQVGFWLRQLFRDTVADGADVRVAATPTHIKCGACGYAGGVELPTDPEFHIVVPAVRCPACDSSDITVERGREVIIKNLRVHKAAPEVGTA